MVGAGDEVIAFDPAYDSYEPAVRLAGGALRACPAHPAGVSLRLGSGARDRHARTRLVLFNSPHNPACTHRQRGGPGCAGGARPRLRRRWCSSDEVYEHVVFDGAQPSLGAAATRSWRSCSFAVFSFGKTLHATGMRVGYCVAPPQLTAELRKVHQFNTFSISNALQHAIASYLAAEPDAAGRWRPSSSPSATACARALAGSGFVLPPAQGTYFQLLDFSAFAPTDDLAFAERLLTEGGVASIPLSPFYEVPQPLPFVRLCIAKKDSTLDEAALRLNAFAAPPGRCAAMSALRVSLVQEPLRGTTRRPTANASARC